jgi:hypothetical protein
MAALSSSTAGHSSAAAAPAVDLQVLAAHTDYLRRKDKEHAQFLKDWPATMFFHAHACKDGKLDVLTAQNLLGTKVSSVIKEGKDSRLIGYRAPLSDPPTSPPSSVHGLDLSATHRLPGMPLRAEARHK